MNNLITLGELPVCGEAVALPINATITGTWAYMSTFNGAYQYVQFQAVENQPMIVPVKLNEDYTYTFKLYQPDGEIFNNSAYSMKTIPMLLEVDYVCPKINRDDNLVAGKIQVIATESQSNISNLLFANSTHVAVFVEGNMWQEGELSDEYVFDKLNNKIEFNSPLIEGQKVTILYFK